MNDFSIFYNLHGPDFSMSGSRTADYFPTETDLRMRPVSPGSTIQMGGPGIWDRPFNTINYGGQTYPYSDGHYRFTTTPVVANFTASQSFVSTTFTFEAQAIARASPPTFAPGVPGYVPGPALQTFDLRGQGIATASFQGCSPGTSCWFYGVSYEFHPTPQVTAPPMAGPSSPSTTSPSPVTEEPAGPTTQSSTQRRVPAQPIQVTGLLDLRQQLIQLKQEWGVSTGTGSALGTMSAMGGSGGMPVLNPEPTTVVLLASGLTGLGIRRFICRRNVWSQ
jgi:hypothetical protein